MTLRIARPIGVVVSNCSLTEANWIPRSVSSALWFMKSRIDRLHRSSRYAVDHVELPRRGIPK